MNMGLVQTCAHLCHVVQPEYWALKQAPEAQLLILALLDPYEQVCLQCVSHRMTRLQSSGE